MHRKPIALPTAAILLLTAFLTGGCGDSISMSDPSAIDDEETLREFLDEDGIFDDMGPYEAGEVSVGQPAGREMIDPLTFWRQITDRDCYREILWDPEEGTAEVTVHRDVWGVLHILGEDMVEYEKPFHHEGIRFANFARDPDWSPANDTPGEPGNGEQRRCRRGPWILTEVSGFVAHSDTVTISIDWVRLQSASVDVTIADALNLMTVPDEIMHFVVGEEVTVTVSGPPEDSLLFLHKRLWKSPFQYQGDGTFVGTWTVGRPGRHGVWIEAMAHGTLFDSEYPEDVLIWGLPYMVADGDEEA
jgi:hypothetical protein